MERPLLVHALAATGGNQLRAARLDLAGHLRFTLFLITLSAVLGLAGFALLSRRVRAFWARVRQGVTILSDRRRYLREVFAVQAVAVG